ncbi:large conductance mechanosensitive channel protein MscL [Cellulomonas endometrii]|uniref:large conductance mechanosensitive channel protein MscL n=1 Tax=Cellulomonas endometrii TaxID=3036301 RepID=UPI0024ADF9D9|nr:large conductance mechanosensitive channel protein MscL [Cellulomonas endometrii]
MSDVLNKGLRTATDRARGLAGVLQGFKDFVSRGNAVELAVGIVIGAAFTSVVGAVQNGFISPLIGMLFGKPAISWKVGPVNGSTIDLGLIVNALIQFLLTAAAIYFLIVLPLNKLAERRKRGIEAEPARPAEDILLLQEIRDLLAAQSAPALRESRGSAGGGAAGGRGAGGGGGGRGGRGGGGGGGRGGAPPAPRAPAAPAPRARGRRAGPRPG